MRKTKLISIVAVSLIVLAILVFKFLVPRFKNNSNAANESAAQEESINAKAAPVAIEAVPAQRGDLVIRISASGKTEAVHQIGISPKVSGTIAELPVKNGAYLQKEELIFKLDDREYQLALEQARNNVLKAQGEFAVRKLDRGLLNQLVDSSATARLQHLRKQWEAAQEQYHRGKMDEVTYQRLRIEYQRAQILSGVRHEEMVAIKSGFADAVIEYERAKLNLANTDIRAPFSGFVGNLQVQQGEFVSAGKECCKLADLSRIRVNVGVLESEIQYLRTGSNASVQLPAFPGEKFVGKVISVNPIIDPDTKTCLATVEISNLGFRIKAGMFAYVKIDAQIYHNCLVVPRSAVLTRDNRTLVFIVRENDQGKTVAVWCYVDTGKENEDYIEITGSAMGLKEGELVITSGHYTLAHDAEVRVVKR